MNDEQKQFWKDCVINQLEQSTRTSDVELIVYIANKLTKEFCDKFPQEGSHETRTL